MGLTPYNAPGVFSLLAGTELTDGVWYPLGGFATVRDGLRRAAERCGARVQTQAEVTAILTDAAGRRVTGVQLADGERLPADVVVCNRDLPAAYPLLEAGAAESSSSGVAEYAQQRHKELGALEYSAGVISYCWHLSRRLETLAHHSVFLSGDWHESWSRATSPSTLQSFPNFYVHAPARTDPGAAPEGHDSIMVLLPVANLREVAAMGAAGSGGAGAGGDPYAALVDAGRERILSSLEASGIGSAAEIRALIGREAVVTPPAWRTHYGLRHGAAFGLAHGLQQLSVFRPGVKDGAVAGLYFAGASTRPGNGVPLCLIGSKLTAGRVLLDLGLPPG